MILTPQVDNLETSVAISANFIDTSNVHRCIEEADIMASVEENSAFWAKVLRILAKTLFKSFFWKDLANRRMSTDIPTSTGMISTLFYSYSQASDRNIIAIFIITIILPLYNCWDSHFLSFRGSHLYRFLPCWQLRRNCAAAEEARAVSLQRDGQRATAPLQIQAWGETCALWDSTKAGSHGFSRSRDVRQGLWLNWDLIKDFDR